MSYKVSILTLGCRVNQYESDSIAAELQKNNIEIVPFDSKADLALVNTCTVTAESDRKSRQMIRRAAQFADKVVCAGCYSQISPESAAESDRVVYVCGNGNKSNLAGVIVSLLEGSFCGDINNAVPPEDIETARMSLLTPMRTRSYIKIEDGCNNHCSYCLIRKARGSVRSKPEEQVISEAAALAEKGAKEIILTGIETGSYCQDTETRQTYGRSLADLLKKVSAINGIERIGLGSLDPTVLNPYFTETVGNLPKVLPHFHISLQSGSTEILARMRRKYTSEMAMSAIERMKAARPDVTFSADIITGFPGETDSDFNDTVDFVKNVRFLHLHIFPYSKRTGTEASDMPDQVDELVKHQRAAELDEIGRNVKKSLLDSYVESHTEKPVSLLVEKNIDGFISGHSEHFVELYGIEGDIEVGDIVNVFLDSHNGEKCTGRL